MATRNNERKEIVNLQALQKIAYLRAYHKESVRLTSRNADIRLLIDTKEQKGTVARQLLEGLPNVHFHGMNEGDFRILVELSPILIVERKDLKDLVHSLHSNRGLLQRAKLAAAPVHSTFLTVYACIGTPPVETVEASRSSIIQTVLKTSEEIERRDGLLQDDETKEEEEPVQEEDDVCIADDSVLEQLMLQSSAEQKQGLAIHLKYDSQSEWHILQSFLTRSGFRDMYSTRTFACEYEFTAWLLELLKVVHDNFEIGVKMAVQQPFDPWAVALEQYWQKETAKQEKQLARLSQKPNARQRQKQKEEKELEDEEEEQEVVDWKDDLISLGHLFRDVKRRRKVYLETMEQLEESETRRLGKSVFLTDNERRALSMCLSKETFEKSRQSGRLNYVAFLMAAYGCASATAEAIACHFKTYAELFDFIQDSNRTIEEKQEYFANIEIPIGTKLTNNKLSGPFAPEIHTFAKDAKTKRLGKPGKMFVQRLIDVHRLRPYPKQFVSYKEVQEVSKKGTKRKRKVDDDEEKF